MLGIVTCVLKWQKYFISNCLVLKLCTLFASVGKKNSLNSAVSALYYNMLCWTTFCVAIFIYLFFNWFTITILHTCHLFSGRYSSGYALIFRATWNGSVHGSVHNTWRWAPERVTKCVFMHRWHFILTVGFSKRCRLLLVLVLTFWCSESKQEIPDHTLCTI